MSLIKCPTCSKEIDKNTNKCVHCGKLFVKINNTNCNKKTSSTLDCLLLIKIFIIIVSICVIASNIYTIIKTDQIILILIIPLTILGAFIFLTIINWMSLILENLNDISNKL